MNSNNIKSVLSNKIVIIIILAIITYNYLTMNNNIEGFKHDLEKREHKKNGKKNIAKKIGIIVFLLCVLIIIGPIMFFVLSEMN